MIWSKETNWPLYFTHLSSKKICMTQSFNMFRPKEFWDFVPPFPTHIINYLTTHNFQVTLSWTHRLSSDLWRRKGLFQNVFGSLPTCNGAFGETVAGQFFGVLGWNRRGSSSWWRLFFGRRFKPINIPRPPVRVSNFSPQVYFLVVKGPKFRTLKKFRYPKKNKSC